SATKELKTKPTQHSVRELRSIGILPDAIICRSDYDVDEDIKTKISIHCDVPVEAVLTLPTVSSVYEVPLILQDEGLGELIQETLHLRFQKQDLVDWRKLVTAIHKPKESMPIAVVGKYVDLEDSYISVKEALLHAGLHFDRDIEVRWVGAEEIEEVGADSLLESVSGIVVPGGFGPRGFEGMIEAVQYARDHEVPFLGLCLGLQAMVVEIARNLMGKDGANSTEMNPNTPYPVIDLMESQKDVDEMGGSMRLGLYPCELVKDTWSSKAYGQDMVQERHRHRWEFNNTFREEFEAVGLWPAGLSPDGKLIEIMEFTDHPFMVGTQFHPEFRSRPNRPHPLFREFIGAAKKIVREGGQHHLPLVGADSAGN
ncbi:MAG: CTP synthase, partial [Chloroflexi bacterium]|nr:CTP synthase [Chloroflexota bacterium]